MKPAPFAYHAPADGRRGGRRCSSRGDERARARRRPEPRAADEVPRAPSRARSSTSTASPGSTRSRSATASSSSAPSCASSRCSTTPVAARSWPLSARRCSYVGYRATRHRGTVGGSLAYAAPWAELTARRRRARRDDRGALAARRAASIAAREFFRGPNETALEPDELITAVASPRRPERTGIGLPRGQRPLPRLRAGRRRRRSSRSTPAAAVQPPSSCCCASPPTPYRADVDAIVRGTRLDDDALDARRGAARRARPARTTSRSRGSYRRRVAGVLARRALRDAAERAAGGGGVTADGHAPTYPVRVEVNGRRREGIVEPRRTLADFLREDLDLTGTHLACEHGFCGNCNVLLDGADRALVPAASPCRPTAARSRRSRASPSRDGTLSALQQAFTRPPRPAVRVLHAGDAADGRTSSCARTPTGGSDEEIREAISGVTCRCTGYQQIVESIRAARRRPRRGARGRSR